MEFNALLSEFNTLTIAIRLLLATVFGILIGFDRSKKGSPAGIKTHVLVSVGSALVMLTSIYAAKWYDISDVVRMPAQVISGIGFLGAGVILVTGNERIKGLTSAASIWFSACIGLAIGIGFYIGALFALVFEVMLFKILRLIDFQQAPTILVELYVEYDQEFQLANILHFTKLNNLELMQVDKQRFPIFNDTINFHNAVLVLQMPHSFEVDKLVEYLQNIQGVKHIEEITPR